MVKRASEKQGITPRVICIDGGPCSGKSTVLDALQARTYDRPVVFVPELASVFGEELLARGTDYPRLAATSRTEYLAYQHRIIGGYITRIAAARAELVDRGGLIVTDRGPAGIAAYVESHEWQGLLDDFGVDSCGMQRNYADSVIFLDSLAVANPSLYERLCRNNDLRTETIPEAARLHQRSFDCWRDHEDIQRIGGADMGQKINTVTQFVLGSLG